MTRAQYVRAYTVSVLGETLVWLSFGALAWNAVLDADTFVRLIETQHYAFALLIVFGMLSYVALATIAIPTLHDMRWTLGKTRQLAIIREHDMRRCARLELLTQEPIENDADARKVLRMADTIQSRRPRR